MVRHLADLNLIRDDQGDVDITLGRARGILNELDDKGRMHRPGQPIDYVDVLVLEAADRLRVRHGRSIPMVLHCPRCGTQHIDQATAEWSNPPHRSHACQREGCGCIWRPSDLPTVGVAAIATRGKADNWESVTQAAERVAAERGDNWRWSGEVQVPAADELGEGEEFGISPPSIGERMAAPVEQVPDGYDKELWEGR
jgi:hypothetical protein